jgi:hypothetical protein
MTGTLCMAGHDFFQRYACRVRCIQMLRWVRPSCFFRHTVAPNVASPHARVLSGVCGLRCGVPALSAALGEPARVYLSAHSDLYFGLPRARRRRRRAFLASRPQARLVRQPLMRAF